MPKHSRFLTKDSRYASHQPVLRFLLSNFNVKTVLELGMGKYSTNLFMKYSVDLTSVDSSQLWLDSFGKHSNKKFCDLENGKKFYDFIDKSYDLVFIDCRPAKQRPLCVNKSFGLAKIIVEHDSENWPDGRINDNKIKWNYIKDRLDSSGEYKLVNMEFFNPNTAVWTNDGFIYQKLLKFKEEMEHPDTKIEDWCLENDALYKKKNVSISQKPIVGIPNRERRQLVNTPNRQHRASVKKRNPNFPRMK